MLAQFQAQKYINVETYRKSGEGVRTPVWFVEMDGKLYVRTGAESGKIKRIGRNPQVKVTPCTATGHVLGEWVSGTAEVVSEEKAKQVNQQLKKKYGMQKMLFDRLGSFQKMPEATFSIQIEEDGGSPV